MRKRIAAYLFRALIEVAACAYVILFVVPMYTRERCTKCALRWDAWHYLGLPCFKNEADIVAYGVSAKADRLRQELRKQTVTQKLNEEPQMEQNTTYQIGEWGEYIFPSEEAAVQYLQGMKDGDESRGRNDFLKVLNITVVRAVPEGWMLVPRITPPGWEDTNNG